MFFCYLINAGDALIHFHSHAPSLTKSTTFFSAHIRLCKSCICLPNLLSCLLCKAPPCRGPLKCIQVAAALEWHSGNKVFVTRFTQQITPVLVTGEAITVH